MAGYTWIVRYCSFYYDTFTWPFPFSLYDVSVAVLLMAIMGVVVLRFARSRTGEDQMKMEREAARVVQQVLVPADNPAIPGFEIDSVYEPAGEVGGDFFQILPTTAGGVLLVIGDVSGKGIPAAMTVSLLVGTFRTLAHYTQSPREILTAMNQRMLARSKDGFTTCLVLRIDSEGTAMIANAGHLTPYLCTEELGVDSGLPLGLAPEAVYTESSFRLDTGAELTLLTDGVAEARAKSGELFGFERTASISSLSAEHITATAKAFGQQDDITVLKIRRCPVPDAAMVPLAASASPSSA
jgi:serine phosphatase RsbU (regulator of sigma subunit)